MKNERGQTLPMAAVGICVAALLFLVVVSVSALLMTVSNAQDVLRDASRAAALTASDLGGGLRLDQTEADLAARDVFYTGIGQVAGWLENADTAPLSVEVLNPPDGGCASFGGVCYWRPAVRLETEVSVRVLLKELGTVSFRLSTVSVSGTGDAGAAPTPHPDPTPRPFPTSVLDITAVP
jgi:hypothetical protein